MPSSQPSPVTAAERVVSLDVVRGLAVLGILVMNIVEFALPMRAYDDPRVAGGTTGADLWTWLTQAVLFDGRMRALFSMLFGAGIVLLSERMARTGRGGATADLLLRRCLWLIPFGIAHRFLLQWTGDILYIYGLLGVLAIALRDLRPRTQLVLGVLALLAFVPIELRKHAQADEVRAAAEQAQTVEARGEPLSPELRAAKARWQRRTATPNPEDNEAELAAMHGSWTDVVRLRWDHNHAFQHAYIYHYFVWDVLGMMLVGMALQRLGFFAGRLRPSTYAAVLAAGVLAAAATGWLALTWSGQQWSRADLELMFWRNTSYPLLRGIAGLGWAAALLLLWRAEMFRRLLRPLAAVGRMALSNYVLQTVCCTVWFFGWGLDHYGDYSRSQLMLVVVAVSAVQLLFSSLWLSRFRFGPLEWAWRSLTYWRRQPMRG